jgi:hypothetical protein
MHRNATKCNKTQSKWCINKHGASKIIDMFETYQIRRAVCLNCLRKPRGGTAMIRPKCIYFFEHFCCYFSSNLYVLNATNTDKRCFQQNCSGVSFFCRNPTFSINPRKYCKNHIPPEDPWSQKTRRGGAGRPHTPRWRGPGLAAPGCGEATPAALSSRPSAYIYPLT